jgi:hypothetical protein
MNITKYDLEICPVCYRLRGIVEEQMNGEVQVLCICDLKEGNPKTTRSSIVGGVITGGKVHLMWKPVSDYIGEDGNWWHVSHFSGFGWANGKPEHKEILEKFLKGRNEVKQKIKSPGWLARIFITK